MDTSAWAEDEDEWELITDDGLVYKRKKRRLDPTSTTTAATPAPDPATEDKIRRERKKRALIKLKLKYQNEIDHWEHLSNSLKNLQQQTQNQPQRQEDFDLDMGSAPLPDQSSESTLRGLVDDLLAQAEAQEAMIHKVSDLCDVAETMCNTQLERSKQSLIDLPIWAESPRELMESLCEE